MASEGANAPSGFPCTMGKISYVSEASPLFNSLLLPATLKERGPGGRFLSNLLIVILTKLRFKTMMSLTVRVKEKS